MEHKAKKKNKKLEGHQKKIIKMCISFDGNYLY